MQDYQNQNRRYSKPKSYNIHGNTITPSNGEYFTKQSLNEALKEFLKMTKAQPKFRKDQTKKRKNLTHKL